MRSKATTPIFLHLHSLKKSASFHRMASDPPNSKHTDSISRHNPREPDKHFPWPSTQIPTPYEIIGMKRGQQYSKVKYYDLVKAYHPDRTMISSPGHLSKEERARRYRLIVAAHEILSNPQKRAVYDLYGLGWLSQRGNGIQTHLHRSGDYHRDASQRPHPDVDVDHPWSFLSAHKYMIRLVVVIFTFGEVCLFLVMLFKAETELKRLDTECRELLRRRRQRTLDADSKMLQIERFLLKRDPSGVGLSLSEEGCYREVIPFCMHLA